MQDRFIENSAGKPSFGGLSRTGLCIGTLGLLGLIGILGCGQQYRPVVSAINPVGPAGQPTKYAVAVSSPSPTTAGLMTLVDFSGDTVLATPSIIPIGATLNPNLFITLANGSQGFVVNAENSLSDVPLSPAVITSSVVQTTLPTGADAASVSAFTFGAAPRIFVPEIGRSSIALLSTASPALQQEIAVSPNPVYVVGVDGTTRAYAISNGNGTGPGEVAAIEASSFAVSATLPVGVDPVYGIETVDGRRAFILNAGSGTLSVINVTNNAFDNATPTIAVGQNPIWADVDTIHNEIVVLNAGNGTTPGSLSIINIPLCSAAAQPTNPTCDPNNPVDGVGFGTVVATVPVGTNPTMVSVLADGSRAYVVNSGSGNCTTPLSTDTAGSVTVVNLVSDTVTATLPAACDLGTAITSTATSVYGHPNTLAATTGTPTGKVYVTSPDSRNMTVIETDTDTVDTHINLQGLGLRVRVTSP